MEVLRLQVVLYLAVLSHPGASLAAWQGGNKHRIDGINMDRIAGCRFARLACAREHALPDLLSRSAAQWITRSLRVLP
jgi:hypothetical protein